MESQNPLKKQRTTLLEQKEARSALYKDSTLFQLCGSVQIPRINVCLLQADIVEQQINSLSMLDNPRDLVYVSSAAVCMTPCRCTSLRTCASADGFRPSAGPSSNGRAEETRASLPASRNPKVGQANGMELLKSSLSSGRKREQTVDGQRQDPPSTATIRRKPDLDWLLRTTSRPESVTVISFDCSRVLFSFASDVLGKSNVQKAPANASVAVIQATC